jgi:hypothetical protein
MQVTGTTSVKSVVLATTAAATRGTRETGLRLARAACIVGLLFAAVSVYWGLGGTWLLDTIPESFERQARAGEAGIFVAVWAAAVLKIIAAVLPLLALRRMTRPMWSRVLWVLAWVAAVFLTLYGLVQTAGAQLAHAGVIDAAAGTGDRSLVWRAFVWDPWFLIWGLIVVAALLHGRRYRAQAAAHVRP